MENFISRWRNPYQQYAKYADDIVNLADSAQDPQSLLNRVNEEKLRVDLKIIISKTKFMNVIRNDISHIQILINEENFEQAALFKALRCMITNRWDMIRRRIEQARTTFIIIINFLQNLKL